MKTITTTKEIYTFEELSDGAQKVVINNMQNDENYLSYEWYDSVYDYAIEAGALMGIRIDKIYFSGFYSQGDGACFEGYYQYEKNSLQNFRRDNIGNRTLLDLAIRLQTLQKRNIYGLLANVKHSGHSYHERCTRINVEHSKGICISDNTDDELSEILRDFMQWIYATLEEEHDYLMSDEVIKETIIANEYDFLIDGSRY